MRDKSKVFKFRYVFSTAIIVGFVLLLSGCQPAVFNPKGIVAAQEKDLFLIALLLMLVIIIPVIILTFVIARRYRESNKKAKYNPNWSHNNLLELVWWIVPIIIIAILGTVTWITTHRLNPYRPLDVPGKPLTIQAISLEWKWLFIYPEQNIATVNYVVLPVNRPVEFLLTSDAPMNSFQIQQLAGQLYSMNGMQTRQHLIANHKGTYRGLSVSFSGEGFSHMDFDTKAVSEKAFDQWVQQVKQSPKALTMKTYKQLKLPSEDNPVAYFSSVQNDLFRDVIMSFMTYKTDPKQQKMVGVQL